MPRIKKDDKLEFTSVAAATAYVKSLRGKVRFQVMVEAFLPTEGDRGFPGSTFITIPKAQFIQVLDSMGFTFVDARGGRFVLRVTGSERKDGLSFVSLY